jgi:hypothetical protein
MARYLDHHERASTRDKKRFFPENRKKYRESFAPRLRIIEFCPKLANFCQKLRKGTGKEQQTAIFGLSL